MSKPKIVQIAIDHGFDGPNQSRRPTIYVLYDDGQVWRALCDDTRDWDPVDTPDEDAATDWDNVQVTITREETK